jgi:hypothetical protein
MLVLLGYSALFLLELGTLLGIAYYVSHEDERHARKASVASAGSRSQPPQAGRVVVQPDTASPKASPPTA